MLSVQDVDPEDYSAESSGHWILSPSYEWDDRNMRLSQKAVANGIACYLPKYESFDPNFKGIPF